MMRALQAAFPFLFSSVAARGLPGDFEKGALRVRRAVEPRASQCLVVSGSLC